MPPNTTVRDVFEDCQTGSASYGHLCKQLKVLYNAKGIATFWEEFAHHLKYALIVSKREPCVERILEMAAKFAVSFAERDDQEQESEEEEPMHEFLLKIFTFMLQSHNANSQAVRFRCCQMVNKLLYGLGEEAQIDDELYDSIHECMMVRLRDKHPAVRVEAVRALARLQDPQDQDCPIIDSYLFLLSRDPNADVRQVVLINIAPSTKTLGAIIDRTADVKNTNRKRALLVLAEKVHIKALTIAQRIRVLKAGLGDREQMVREACLKPLIHTWLQVFEGNILELLQCLDVENALETGEKMLKAIFAKASAENLVSTFDLLNDELVVPVEKLTCEAVLYWRVLCEHVRGAGDADADRLLDTILPTVTHFANYIQTVFDVMKEEEDLDAQLRNEFVLCQLLALAGSLDLSDEAGRRNMRATLQGVLQDDHLTYSLVKPLLDRYADVVPDQEARINALVEVISAIREPVAPPTSGGNAAVVSGGGEGEAGERVATELQEVLTAIPPGLADTQGAPLRDDATTLLKCLTIAADMLVDVSLPSLLPALITLMEVLIVPGILNQDPAVRNTAVRALGLCCLMSTDTAKVHLLLFVQISQVDLEMVQVTALRVIFDLLLTFGLDVFAVEADSGADPSDDVASRNPDLDSDSDSGLDDSDDFEPSRRPAARRPTQERQEEQVVHTATTLLSIFTRLLDSEMSDVRTVVAEGLAKLLVSGRVVSAGLFSRLILLWYNPVTEDDTHLRHCLGTFFPIYALSNRASQEVVAAAILPILRTLFRAPASSPLAEVKVENVIDLLVQLSDPHNLMPQQDNSQDLADTSCHDDLAVKVANEILTDPNSFHSRTLCRLLNMLELSRDRASLKQLRTLTKKMLKEVRDKTCTKYLTSFHRQVKDYLLEIAAQKSGNMSAADTGDETALEDTRWTSQIRDETMDTTRDVTQSDDGRLSHDITPRVNLTVGDEMTYTESDVAESIASLDVVDEEEERTITEERTLAEEEQTLTTIVSDTPPSDDRAPTPPKQRCLQEALEDLAVGARQARAASEFTVWQQKEDDLPPRRTRKQPASASAKAPDTQVLTGNGDDSVFVDDAASTDSQQSSDSKAHSTRKSSRVSSTKEVPQPKKTRAVRNSNRRN